jgi:hypothetical protein
MLLKNFASKSSPQRPPLIVPASTVTEGGETAELELQRERMRPKDATFPAMMGIIFLKKKFNNKKLQRRNDRFSFSPSNGRYTFSYMEDIQSRGPSNFDSSNMGKKLLVIHSTSR